MAIRPRLLTTLASARPMSEVLSANANSTRFRRLMRAVAARCVDAAENARHDAVARHGEADARRTDDGGLERRERAGEDGKAHERSPRLAEERRSHDRECISGVCLEDLRG